MKLGRAPTTVIILAVLGFMLLNGIAQSYGRNLRITV
jgi:hypothetical protein